MRVSPSAPVDRPRKTVAMPPPPILAKTSYGPRRAGTCPDTTTRVAGLYSNGIGYEYASVIGDLPISLGASPHDPSVRIRVLPSKGEMSAPAMPTLALVGGHSVFQERAERAIPIRDLGLTISGTPLEPVLATFERELETAGIKKIHPRFYLSTEWGVPYETIAIAIPFYLARPELTVLQAEQACHVEGSGAKDILRYLRHEMGHVVNYAYRLHESKEWQERFGQMSRPYEEEYRPRPFSREFVHHLPGWYAQKHPDEDWSETFAVWMTPGLDWRPEYAKWPGALRKLEFCDRLMAEIRESDPVVTTMELDEDVANLSVSLEQFYRDAAGAMSEKPQGLEQMLTTIFADGDGGVGVRLA